MANSFFQFKKFTINQANAGMKVTTDACLFGAWVAQNLNTKPQQTCLDIGMGTGLLTCLLAQMHNLKFTGIDVNDNAIIDAANNIAQLPFTATINIIQTALQSYKPIETFDYIICNPPFFTNSLKGQNVAKTLAMHNDDLPLNILLHFIAENLNPNGTAYILYHPEKLKAIKITLKNLSLSINKITFVHQTENHDAFRVMLQIAAKEAKLVTEKIIIKENNVYSIPFASLLKPYYLHL